ncbi:unnamed protein product [Didymodactylos carnosus]|uniref:Uncharacterized protein n=1 Tax=Didymodactylos carnosus TaxID=1234261 RepID=A0A815UW89_9BILA|nr:unnamed protein product [Didymodactylos carnosus]CAF1524816.1 unnamed protein product [Didymodactylos carnosus]CAF3683276.1 unnamed protein product [Didymodactylos carnosus]CAF4383767.1 unnamed protein product [Didymodactylos carnosus]
MNGPYADNYQKLAAFDPTKNPYNMLINDAVDTHLRKTFGKYGSKFILYLYSNGKHSQRRLSCAVESTSNENEISATQIKRRLITFDIVANLLAIENNMSNPTVDLLLLLHDNYLPKTYLQFIHRTSVESAKCDNDTRKQYIQQMKCVIQGVNKRNTYICKCSEICDYMFYFENCGKPKAKNNCPICNQIIGGNEVFTHKLYDRDPPQISMLLKDGLKFIDNCIKKYENNEIINEQNQNHLSTLGKYVLRLISHSLLLITDEMQLFKLPKDFYKDVNSKNVGQFLQKEIEADIESIINILNEDNCRADYNLWLYTVCKSLESCFAQEQQQKQFAERFEKKECS